MTVIFIVGIRKEEVPQLNTLVFYFLMPVFCFLMYLTLPKQWKRTRKARIGITAAALFGVFSSHIMITIARITEAPVIRESFVNITLLYYIATSAGIAFFLLRYLLTFLAINLHRYKAAAVLLSGKGYLFGVTVITLLSILFGTLHFDRQIITEYEVDLSDERITDPALCKIGMLCDIHLGAGATTDAVDHMCALLSAQEYDLICICGDVVDMSSFRSDAEYFAEALSAVPTKYGIYFAEGNHEQDAVFALEPILTAHGIRCLRDSAAEPLPGLAVVGRSSGCEIPVETVLRESGIAESDCTVVLQHIPQGLSAMSDRPYLVLCGHSHGYESPLYGLLLPFKHELPYGYRRFGELQAITGSGVSTWGFRVKWPSYNEIVTVNVTY